MKQYKSHIPAALLSIVFLPLVSFSTHTSKPKSEREFDGLKGAVKSTKTEKSSLSTVDGKLVEDKREVISIESYDETGNLTRIEEYEDGTPLDVDIYFFLDGERVYKTEVLRQSKLYGNRGGSTFKPGSKPDPRFTIMLRYKYDDRGNRIEKTIFSNRGETTSRHEYKYDSHNNLATDIVHLLIGKSTTTHTTTYKVDEKGNVVDISRKPDFKISYTYQTFDGTGNWTKRTGVRVSKTGEKTYESSAVYYRTIAYF